MSMLTPNKIRGYQFQQAGRGTYRADEVDDFLNQIVESYEQVFKENGELVKKLNILATKLNEYRKEEANISKALVNAQSFIDRMVEEANKDAKRIVAEAEERAKNVDSITNAKIKVMVDEVEGKMRVAYDKAMAQAKQTKEDAYKESETMLLEARQKAEITINSAKESASTIISEATREGEKEAAFLKAEIEKEKEVLDNLKETSNQFKTELVVLYERQIKNVEQMPDYRLSAELEKTVQGIVEEKNEQGNPKTVEQIVEEITLDELTEETFDADELILEYADKEEKIEEDEGIVFDFAEDDEEAVNSTEETLDFDFKATEELSHEEIEEQTVENADEEIVFDFAEVNDDFNEKDSFEDIFSDSGETTDGFRFTSDSFNDKSLVTEDEIDAPFEFETKDVNIFNPESTPSDISFKKPAQNRKFDVAFSKKDAVKIEKNNEVLYGQNESVEKAETGFKFFDNVDMSDTSFNIEDASNQMDADDVFGKPEDDDSEGFSFLKNIFGKK